MPGQPEGIDVDADREAMRRELEKLKTSHKTLRTCLGRKRASVAYWRGRSKRLAAQVIDFKAQLQDEKRRRTYVLKPDAQRRRCTLTLPGLYRLAVKRNIGDTGCLSLIDTLEAQVDRELELSFVLGWGWAAWAGVGWEVGGTATDDRPAGVSAPTPSSHARLWGRV